MKPESVVCGTNCCSNDGTSKLVYESFQYVSVKKTLQSLMQSKSFVEVLLEDKCTPAVLQEFVDRNSYKTHSLLSDSNKITIMMGEMSPPSLWS